MTTRKTLVGDIESEVLSFTMGKDPVLDLRLAEVDCIGSAAHVTMLARIRSKPQVLTADQRRRLVAALVSLIRRVRRGNFQISDEDQDVHLAVERWLSAKCGELGRRVHTARSRNDQVALDLRLYARDQMLDAMQEAADLAQALLALAAKHRDTPMVGRTHGQPAMPSSVALWASAHAESLLDDLALIEGAYALNDRSPLGSAAGYGVPLAIDPPLTARLLGFRGCYRTVLYASHARGKCEAAILTALAQAMISLSRLAEDLILYSMPEFGYFSLPAAYCTGSSIMPQKRNPDVLELVRAKAARVWGCASVTAGIVKGLAGGYSRDLQETKEPFMEGIDTTRACLRIVALLVRGVNVHKPALLAGFTPSVFAADRALTLVARGMAFRDAYDEVKANLDDLAGTDPCQALGARRHVGAPGALDIDGLTADVAAVQSKAAVERRRCDGCMSNLLGVAYPALSRRKT